MYWELCAIPQFILGFFPFRFLLIEMQVSDAFLSALQLR